MVGVRELRKQQTRQRIADAALELFSRDGFDNVTAAQVATAAGVTEKTVFNHFETKEDLVYSRDAAFEAALLDSVRFRAAGESVVAAIERFLLDRYRRAASSANSHRARTLAGLVAASPALQARERDIHARYADALCDLIAEEQHAALDDIRPRIAAEALLAVHRGAIAALRRGVRTDASDAEVAERVTTAARQGFRFVASGMATYATRGRHGAR